MWPWNQPRYHRYAFPCIPFGWQCPWFQLWKKKKEIRSKLHLKWILFSHFLGETKAFPEKIHLWQVHTKLILWCCLFCIKWIFTHAFSFDIIPKLVIEDMYSTFILQNPFMKEARPILKSFHSWSTLLTRVIKVHVLILAFIQLDYAKANFMNMAIVWRATNRPLSSEYSLR